MTAAQILGVVLIVLPFVALGIYAVRGLGWGAFAFVFGARCHHGHRRRLLPAGVSMMLTLGQLAAIAVVLERHAPHAEKLRAVIDAMLRAKRAETTTQLSPTPLEES